MTDIEAQVLFSLSTPVLRCSVETPVSRPLLPFKLPGNRNATGLPWSVDVSHIKPSWRRAAWCQQDCKYTGSEIVSVLQCILNSKQQEWSKLPKMRFDLEGVWSVTERGRGKRGGCEGSICWLLRVTTVTLSRFLSYWAVFASQALARGIITERLATDCKARTW